MQVLSPADVARKENLLLPSVLDSGALPVKVSPVTSMFPDIETLTDATRDLGRHRFCVRLAPEKENGLEDWKKHPGSGGRSKLCMRVAFRRDATAHDVIVALLTICEARRSLYEMMGTSAEDNKWWSRGKCDWGSVWNCQTGTATAEASGKICAAQRMARRNIKLVKKELIKEGWLCDHFLLSQSERVRYSVT